METAKGEWEEDKGEGAPPSGLTARPAAGCRPPQTDAGRVGLLLLWMSVFVAALFPSEFLFIPSSRFRFPRM